MSGGDAKLVRMANQIATFFETQPGIDPAAATAAHLNDFWPPPMRARLLEMIAEGGTGLRPAAAGAAPLIRRPGEAPVHAVPVDPGVPPVRAGEEAAPANPAFQSEGGSDG
ncbi:hypothetical protein GI374_10155 [Paracoccus sp. S-4012]|uniref:formate dehydrogenase subunit delta n=1 Tax=Paracoccus sp. S-4012 TaxID=2665648 RepID=UPI0012B01BD9|nr:hypothetical protein [Paracoccus sp. S-4012]